MNNVAVTDGDKVSAEQVLGYHVDYYPINDVMTYYNAVSDEDVKALVAEYFKLYDHAPETGKNARTEAYTKVWNSAKGRNRHSPRAERHGCQRLHHQLQRFGRL